MHVKTTLLYSAMSQQNNVFAYIESKRNGATVQSIVAELKIDRAVAWRLVAKLRDAGKVEKIGVTSKHENIWIAVARTPVNQMIEVLAKRWNARMPDVA